MVKIAGICMVVFACAMLGKNMSDRLAARKRTLEHLHHFLTTLSNEISFSLEPLPDIIGRVSREDLGHVSEFARYVARELHNRENATLREVWLRGLDKYRKALGISDETLAVLRTLGKKLGTMSKDIEVGNIALALGSIEEEGRRVQTLYDKNSKLYRNLSIMAGVLIVVILF